MLFRLVRASSRGWATRFRKIAGPYRTRVEEEGAVGGLGSGRPRCRATVDEMASLDVRRLRREGRLEPGQRGAVRLSRGPRGAGPVDLHRCGDVLVLGYGLASESE